MTKPTDFTPEEWTEIYYTPIFAAQLIMVEHPGKMGKLAELAAANAVLQDPFTDEAYLDKLRKKNAISALFSVTSKAKDPHRKQPHTYDLDTLEPATDVDAPELIQYLVAEVRRRTVETGVADTPLKAKEIKSQEQIDQLLARIQKTATVVKAKAAPEEADAWEIWVMHTAESTAEAATEKNEDGKKVQVSEGEKAMLARIQQALNA